MRDPGIPIRTIVFDEHDASVWPQGVIHLGENTGRLHDVVQHVPQHDSIEPRKVWE